MKIISKNGNSNELIIYTKNNINLLEEIDVVEMKIVANPDLPLIATLKCVVKELDLDKIKVKFEGK